MSSQRSTLVLVFSHIHSSITFILVSLHEIINNDAQGHFCWSDEVNRVDVWHRPPFFIQVLDNYDLFFQQIAHLCRLRKDLRCHRVKNKDFPVVIPLQLEDVLVNSSIELKFYPRYSKYVLLAT